jgi:hypothetical protein
MQVVPKELSDGGGVVAQVVSAVLDTPDAEPLSASLAPPPIPSGLTPRQQLFAYVMACGAPRSKRSVPSSSGQQLRSCCS